MLKTSPLLFWYNLATINTSQSCLIPWLSRIPKTNRKALCWRTTYHTLLDILLQLLNSTSSCKIASFSHFLLKMLFISCLLHPLHHLFHSFNLVNTLRCAITPVIIYLFVNFWFKAVFLFLFVIIRANCFKLSFKILVYVGVLCYSSSNCVSHAHFGVYSFVDDWSECVFSVFFILELLLKFFFLVCFGFQRLRVEKNWDDIHLLGPISFSVILDHLGGCFVDLRSKCWVLGLSPIKFNSFFLCNSIDVHELEMLYYNLMLSFSKIE